MERAVVDLPRMASRGSALVTVRSAPDLTPRFPGPPASDKEPVKQVEIQWQPVLRHLLQMLGGTEPVYRLQEVDDMMFQATVMFRLYLDNSKSIFEDIVATGDICFATYEAESEAAAAALQKFELGRWFGARIMDISRIRCEELEEKCYRFLAKAEELYNATKITLSAWEANIQRIDACCGKLSGKVVQRIRGRQKEICGEIMLDAADRLFKAKKATDSKFGDFLVESEELKQLLADVKDRVNNHFFTALIDTIDRQESVVPTDINLSMKIILDEMMNSIGWPEPCFTVTYEGNGTYICDTYLSPDENYIEEEGSKLKIPGLAASSEADAVESSCKAAILLMESTLRICLVDPNYGRRFQAEHCLSEAKYVMESALCTGTKILGEWGTMVDGIYKCQQYYTDLAVKHTGPKLADEVYYVKRECAVDADRLCKTCFADLHLANRRFANVGTWMDEEPNLG
ncbi:hypothetical protein ACQ4PT_058748 [Festuca glaucescens]